MVAGTSKLQLRKRNSYFHSGKQDNYHYTSRRKIKFSWNNLGFSKRSAGRVADGAGRRSAKFPLGKSSGMPNYIYFDYRTSFLPFTSAFYIRLFMFFEASNSDNVSLSSTLPKDITKLGQGGDVLLNSILGSFNRIKLIKNEK